MAGKRVSSSSYWHLVDTGPEGFVVGLRYPNQTMPGNTVVLQARFFHKVDGLVNPSNVGCVIYEGTQQSTLIATLSPQQDPNWGQGFFVANFNVPTNQPTGPLQFYWTGSYMPKTMPGPLSINVFRSFRVINPSRHVD
jgi:hypothetical protein